MNTIVKSVKNFEDKFLTAILKKIDILFIIAISLLALVIRYEVRDFISNDMKAFLIPWFEQCSEHTTFWGGVKDNIGNYNALYQIIIWLMTKLHKIAPINPVYLYKILSVVFDYLLAGAMAAVAYHLSDKNKTKAIIAYAIALLHPVVWINSAMWGQCDSIYTFWCVLCLLLLYKEKYSWAYISFGFAFAFKLQAIFLLPALIIHYIINRKKYSIFNFLYIPAVLYLTALPVIILRRNILAPIDTYIWQTRAGQYLSYALPNFWQLELGDYNLLHKLAIVLTISLLGALAYWLIKNNTQLTSLKSILLVSALSIGIAITFMPGMRERYDFCLLVILGILIFSSFKYCIPYLIVTCADLVTYTHFLTRANEFSINLKSLTIAYILGLFYLLYLTVKHFNNESNTLIKNIKE